jgi:hypothetical protein
MDALFEPITSLNWYVRHMQRPCTCSCSSETRVLTAAAVARREDALDDWLTLRSLCGKFYGRRSQAVRS